MSTAAILLTFVIVLGLGAIAALVYVSYLLGEIQRLTEARHTSSRPCGELPPARPGTRLLTSAEAAAHADAMWKAGEPYLPQPNGRHMQAWPPLTERTIPVAQTKTRAPWETETAAQPALTQEMQDMRAEYIASRLREAEELTPEVMREAMTSAPGYGVDRCEADVLAAEQEGRLAS